MLITSSSVATLATMYCLGALMFAAFASSLYKHVAQDETRGEKARFAFLVTFTSVTWPSTTVVAVLFLTVPSFRRWVTNAVLGDQSDK